MKQKFPSSVWMNIVPTRRIPISCGDITPMCLEEILPSDPFRIEIAAVQETSGCNSCQEKLEGRSLLQEYNSLFAFIALELKWLTTNIYRVALLRYAL